MTKDEIHICMICDDNYGMPASVAMTSFVAHKKPDEIFHFHIVASALSHETQQVFRSFARTDVVIDILEQDPAIFAGAHKFDPKAICVASISALFKFMLADLLPDLDKVLYIDGDIVARVSLSEVYNLELGDEYAAVIAESGQIYYKHEYVKRVFRYFNSGVMLLNLKLMREKEMSRVLLECKRNQTDSNLMDQNVFNVVFDGHLKYLPIRYNFSGVSLIRAQGKWTIAQVNELYGTDYANERDMFADAAIIHYSSKDKPWKTPDGVLTPEWRRYYAMAPVPHPLLPEGSDHCNCLVSVVIPCFNVENYIGETLDSILAQTYTNLEIICLDDGSQDKTVSVLKKYASRHDNIVVKKNKNHHQGWERNLGIKLAHGKYIYFMDSDDILERNAISELVSYSEQNELDLIYFEADSFYETEALKEQFPGFANLYRRKYAFPAVYKGEDLYFSFRERGGIIISPCLQFARRQFIVDNGLRFPELPTWEDNIYTMDALFAAKRVTVITASFYLRRVREGSTMTATLSADKCLAIGAIAEQVLQRAETYEEGGRQQVLLREQAVGYLCSCQGAFKQDDGADKRVLKDAVNVHLKASELVTMVVDYHDRMVETKKKQRESDQALKKLRAHPVIQISDAARVGGLLPNWRMDVRAFSAEKGGGIVLDVVSKGVDLSCSSPKWMQCAGATGQSISGLSSKGTLSLKPSVDGKMALTLMGREIHTQDGKARVPFLVDYTLVKVNGKEMLKAPITVWHDAPKKFAIDVKAGEEIKIEVQTVPHVYERAVLRDMLLKAKLPVEVTGKNVDAILDEPAMLTFQRRPMEEVAGVLGSWNVDCHYTEAEVGALELTNGDADVWSSLMHGTDAFLRVVSEASRRKLTFKSKGAGDVRIALMGPAVFAASDGKTPLPAHADFTSVKVRGKEMLAKPVSVCRTKPHWFTIKVAAGEMVDIEVTTTPHVYGHEALKDLLLKGKWPVSVPPVCVDEWLSEPLFNRYLTRSMDAPEDRVWTPNYWRMDLSYAAADVVKLDPIGSSADIAITSPAWMNRSGKGGLSIAGSAFRSRISCVAQGAGKVTVELRGQDIRMRMDGKSRVPFFVDYTSVKVRGVEILKEKVSVWHDKPHKFTIDVQAGETFEIAVVTTPHVYERTVLRDVLLKAKLPVAVDEKNVDQMLDAPEMVAFLLRPQEVLAQKTVLPEVLKEEGARTKASRRSVKEARRVAALERRAEENAQRAEELLMRLQEANAHAEAEAKKVEELEKRLAAAQEAAVREKRKTEAKEQEVAALKASEAYAVGMSLTKPARAIKRALTGKK